MYITSQTLRTIAWSALTLSAARAQYVIDNLSFGQKEGEITPNPRGIPHFHVVGSDSYEPEILSDRVFLTPVWPGNRRGAIWAEEPLHHQGDWTAELTFRATGVDRGNGNLQLWYVSETQKSKTPSSLYTAPKFDGLVLVVDQYEGRGGSVRAFLNDGNIDIKSHPDPDTLAFGVCNYAYRNLGRLSTIKLHHVDGLLEVLVDDRPCISTNKIRLPEGNYFGISASSAENPDSFEIHKFIVSSKNAYGREEPNRQFQQQKLNKGLHERVQQHQQQMQEEIQRQLGSDGKTPIGEIPKMLQDVLAGSINSQADQFADLHNRIQIMNHRVNEIYDMVARMEKSQADQFNNLMQRVGSVDDRAAAMMRNVEKTERTGMRVLQYLEDNDFKDTLKKVHNAIQENHVALSSNMPLAMAHIVGTHKVSMTTYVFVAIAVQIMVVGAYMIYKNRRKGAPKKYL